ncbi:MAG TPA: phosphatase PAP2 family protein [Pyrinomonadaceae bacterium]|nr:phosphatase PAP2 family protein [Pyrinomonadaceae bacterium]
MREYWARDALGYIRNHGLPALGLLLSLGLVAAAGCLFLFLYLAVEMKAGNTRQFDESALALLNQFASPRLTFFMRIMTYLGSNGFLIFLGTYVVIAFALVRWKRAMVTFLVTMAGAAVLNSTLKMIFGRARPEPFFGILPPASYSFPSGHALFSFCFYGVVAAVITARIRGTGKRIAIWIGAFVLVILIGLSRVYLGVHYPSDVVAGYAVGFVWVMVVASADRIMRRE